MDTVHSCSVQANAWRRWLTIPSTDTVPGMTTVTHHVLTAAHAWAKREWAEGACLTSVVRGISED